MPLLALWPAAAPGPTRQRRAVSPGGHDDELRVGVCVHQGPPAHGVPVQLLVGVGRFVLTGVLVRYFMGDTFVQPARGVLRQLLLTPAQVRAMPDVGPVLAEFVLVGAVLEVERAGEPVGGLVDDVPDVLAGCPQVDPDPRVRRPSSAALRSSCRGPEPLAQGGGDPTGHVGLAGPQRTPRSYHAVSPASAICAPCYAFRPVWTRVRTSTTCDSNGSICCGVARWKAGSRT